ncbi:hypothetical protein AJ80_09820 [Polytolypa hystricis UAMH7299]|uniref:Uncharacterized protein n=1 Tax=Polytolypa hystricis (strain UAMH7299) TaxID=1447883 RepID=A0A2B7WIX6_POLH7|nr:hypothetical protein AJ80_09820 [Polytolypa hystricis UAMH7299]
MALIEYAPFDTPRHVGWLLADLFDLYCSWLQKTSDLEVCCKDTTGEEVNFPTSSTLLQECPKICYPEKTTWGLPDDYNFTGFMGIAVDQVSRKVEIPKAELFSGPLLQLLYEGIIVEHHRRILGYRFFQHRPDHWSCMLRDHSSPFDPRQEEDRRDYLLKSEIIAITAMMYRQMNEMVWFSKEDKYRARMRYKGGLLTIS